MRTKTMPVEELFHTPMQILINGGRPYSGTPTDWKPIWGKIFELYKQPSPGAAPLGKLHLTRTDLQPSEVPTYFLLEGEGILVPVYLAALAVGRIATERELTVQVNTPIHLSLTNEVKDEDAKAKMRFTHQKDQEVFGMILRGDSLDDGNFPLTPLAECYRHFRAQLKLRPDLQLGKLKSVIFDKLLFDATIEDPSIRPEHDTPFGVHLRTSFAKEILGGK